MATTSDLDRAAAGQTISADSLEIHLFAADLTAFVDRLEAKWVARDSVDPGYAGDLRELHALHGRADQLFKKGAWERASSSASVSTAR
jgi:hypothetical protein